MKKIKATTALLILTFIAINSKGIDQNRRNASVTRQENSSQVQPGVLVLKLKPEYRAFCSASSITEPKVQAILSQFNSISVAKKFPHSHPLLNAKNSHGENAVDLSLIYQVKVSMVTDIQRLIQKLNATGVVAYAEPLYIQKMDYTPNDPSVGSQYQFARISAYSA